MSTSTVRAAARQHHTATVLVSRAPASSQDTGQPLLVSCETTVLSPSIATPRKSAPPIPRKPVTLALPQSLTPSRKDTDDTARLTSNGTTNQLSQGFVRGSQSHSISDCVEGQANRCMHELLSDDERPRLPSRARFQGDVGNLMDEYDLDQVSNISSLQPTRPG